MLAELHIRDLALVEDVHLEFTPGFNVVTGETGAGKSILVGALTLALGGRAAADDVRADVDAGFVEAVFQLPDDHPVWQRLRDLGIDGEPGEELILSRRLTANGRSQCRVNGRALTVTALRDLGESLVNIHGQHEHQALLRPGMQRQFLDDFAGTPVAQAAGEYAERLQSLRNAESHLADLQRDDRDRTQRIDLLQFQLNEIESAGIDLEVDGALDEERARLMHVEQLRTGCQTALARIGSDDSGARDQLAAALSAVESAADLDAGLRPLVERLSATLVEVDDAVDELRGYTDSLQADPQRLEQIEERLVLLQGLQRKYGPELADVLAYAGDLRPQLDDLLHHDQRLEELQHEVLALRRQLAESAEELSRRRKTAARKLEKAVVAHLRGLAMDKTRFRISLDRQPQAEGLPVKGGPCAFDSHGIDRIEFTISANPGQPLRPLARIASGGELSRFMLALKSVVQDGGAPTLVFDEIDAGIGGAVAGAVGERLRELGRRRQVLCVTHQPQIAGQADHHVVVAKSVTRSHTRVSVQTVSDEDRVQELARMLAGTQATDTTLRQAEELLARGASAREAS